MLELIQLTSAVFVYNQLKSNMGMVPQTDSTASFNLADKTIYCIITLYNWLNIKNSVVYQ